MISYAAGTTGPSLSTEIPWDKSRMEWKPVDMTVTYNGNGEFTASTPSGISFPMEAPVGMGGHGKIPNPIQYLVGSLGGCVGVKILLALSDNGIVPAGADDRDPRDPEKDHAGVFRSCPPDRHAPGRRG